MHLIIVGWLVPFNTWYSLVRTSNLQSTDCPNLCRVHSQFIGWQSSKFSIISLAPQDWGGNTSDGKSKTGFLIYVGGVLVSWGSNTVACSSIEAEYRTIATTTQEIEGVHSALFGIGITVNRPMMILADNQGASFIANNLVGHSRMKHVALDFHFVRERTEKGKLVVKHISGIDQWVAAHTNGWTF